MNSASATPQLPKSDFKLPLIVFIHLKDSFSAAADILHRARSSSAVAILIIALAVLAPQMSKAQSNAKKAVQNQAEEENSETKKAPLPVGAVVKQASPLDLPHIQQASGTKFCGPSVVLTAYQRQTGLRLNDRVTVQRLASMVMESAGDPNFGLAMVCLYPPLNFNFLRFNFCEKFKITDVRKASALALTALRKDIIPALQGGAYFSFSVTSGSPRGHAILVTSYNAKTDKLKTHDPLLNKASEIAVSEFAKKWPLMRDYSKYFALDTEKLEFPPCAELRDPPQNACVNILAEALQKLKISEVLTPQMLDWAEGTTRLGANTDWKHLSKWWDKRDPRKVLGVADIVRIKVAQGEPPLMVFDKGDQKLQIVAVTGYRGGYCSPVGEIQLTMLNEGRLMSHWMSVSDFLFQCSPKQGNGQYGCYIGYPKVSLRDPAQDLASLSMDKGKTDGGAIQIKDVPVGIVPDVPPPAAGVIRIEGESFVPATKPSGGTIRSQTLGSAYSGDKQLWWTNGHPGDVLTLKLDQGNVGTGSYDVTLFPTYSWDYAQIKVKMGGQEKSVDLYAKKVRPGDPLQFNEVVVKPDAPLLIEIQITDKNAAAKPGYMAGFDRIELRPSEVN